MHRLIPPLALSVSLLSLTACPSRTAPSAERAARAVRVPPGCEQGQAGVYHHADNPAFRYVGQDDGGTLTLAVARARADAGTQAPDGGTVSIVVSRTPEGFVGQTLASAFNASGTPCPVAFPTEVTACTDAGLTLRSAASLALGEDCLPASSGPAPTRLTQQLVRGEPAAEPSGAEPSGAEPSMDGGS